MRKLSIIVSCYNAQNYIKNFMLNSIIHFIDYKNIEVLFINDGSTDNTLKLLKNYKSKTQYKKIRIYTKSNGGLSSARNFGIVKANGKWLWFCDIDDNLINENEVHDLLNKIDNIKEKIVHFNIRKKNYTNQNEIKEYISKNVREFIYNSKTKKMFFDQAAWSKWYRADLFESIKWPENILCEDIVFSSYILSHNSIHYYDVILYEYLTNVPGSILNKMKSWKKGNNNNIDQWLLLANTTEIIEYKIAILFLLTTHLNILTKEYKIAFKKLFQKYNNTNLYKWYFKRNIIHKISYMVLKLRMFWLFSIIKKIVGSSQ